MKVLSTGLGLSYLHKRGFCVNEDMDSDDGVSDDVSGGDGSSEGVGAGDDGVAGGAVGGSASVIGGGGGDDDDNSAGGGVDADGHRSREEKTVYSSYAPRQELKAVNKTCSESALTGLEISLVSRGTSLTFEGPHLGLPNFWCKQPSFSFSSCCLSPFPVLLAYRGVPIVRQVGHAAPRNSGKSKRLGKINRLMQIV